MSDSSVRSRMLSCTWSEPIAGPGSRCDSWPAAAGGLGLRPSGSQPPHDPPECVLNIGRGMAMESHIESRVKAGWGEPM